MRRTPPCLTLFFVAILALVLSGVGCKTTPSSPDPLDPDGDGIVTDEEFGDALEDLLLDVDRREMTFAHVKPGEYSEVYLTFRTSEATFEARLNGPAVADPATQRSTPNEDGFVHFTWRVYSDGRYRARVFFVRPSGRLGFLYKDEVTVE